MEDDNGLELSLGLSFGGSAGKSKSKNGSPSDTKSEEGDRGNKIGDEFKNFLPASTQKQDSGAGSQRSDSVKPQENFFNDLSKASSEADASTSLNTKGLWVTKSSRSADIEEEKQPEASNKRKMLFDEISNKKRHETEGYPSDLHDKAKTSHISITTTTEGSTAENEDVAESEVEGSTSRPVPHHDDGSKQYIAVGGSEIPKEIRGFSDSSVVDLHGQKRFSGSSENELKVGNLSYGVPFSVQPLNMMNIPYTISVREPNSAGIPSTSIVGMTQKMPIASGERSGAPTVNPGNPPVMFGYSPVQLPLFDKDNSWGLVSQSQQVHPSYVSRGPPNSDKHNDGMKISQAATHFDGRTLEWAKGEGKHLAAEAGSSVQAEDVKVSAVNHKAKDISDRPTPAGRSLDLSAIKPGIAAEVKFGGSGSYPNLPWVSTTGSGPNGRTISGVTYRYSSNQIRIVCACHGTHMSPEEFIRHASDENVNPDSGTGVVAFPSSNPAASAQS